MKKILNFGSLNLDYVYHVDNFVRPGETISAKSVFVNCGGKGLNQSIAAAKAGAKVFHAGKIGKDGSVLKQELEDNGVNTDYLKQSETYTGNAIIQVDKNGQNNIILFAGSNHEIAEDEIDDCIRNFDKGDYLILQNEINNISYLMKSASDRGMYIVFNPSPINDSIYEYPIELVSLLILNEIEGNALTGKNEPYEIIDSLKVKYPNTDVLLTLGKDGAVFFDGEKNIKHGIYKTKVVDTTAAGDTVLGYFVAEMSKGLNAEKALELASRASSITVSRSGAAASIPDEDEVLNNNFEYLG